MYPEMTDTNAVLAIEAHRHAESSANQSEEVL
jgi:hypothetical protein